jgi:hypothetical protein
MFRQRYKQHVYTKNSNAYALALARQEQQRSLVIANSAALVHRNTCMI